jgi:hypothetical protein
VQNFLATETAANQLVMVTTTLQSQAWLQLSPLKVIVPPMTRTILTLNHPLTAANMMILAHHLMTTKKVITALGLHHHWKTWMSL